MKKCTLPELTEMIERAKIEHPHHVCPLHRIHVVKNFKLLDGEYAPTTN